ncbi:MAG: MFS transporter [Lachnospiraceae bacterium]|nr:MFS transporter [Lachnospiraceae bacterium]
MKRINGKIKTFWGISDIGFSFMATMETSFFVYFLTDVSQLPLGIVALITGSSALIDAISAVLAGIVIDKAQLKKGKYRPWLLYCPPFVTVFFVLMFTKIGSNVTAGLLCGLGYVLSHFIWNISWTANRNLISVLTDDTTEKAFLSSRIAMGATGGKLLASYAVPALSSALFGILGGIPAYTVIAIIVSVLFVCTYFTHYFITDGYDTPEDQINSKAVTFRDMGKSIVSNPHLIVFLCHDAIRLIAYYGVAAAASYYAKYLLGGAASAGVLLVFFNLGNIIGSGFSQKAVAKWGTKKTNIIGMLGFIVLHLVCYFVPANVFLISALLFVSQLFFGMSYGLTSSMYAMCGTYSEWKNGGAAKGVIMSFCSLAIKIGVAVRGVLITAFLGFIAYDPNMTAATVEMQNGLKMLFVIVPVVILAVSMIPLLMFRLTDEKVASMEQEISARRN